MLKLDRRKIHGSKIGVLTIIVDESKGANTSILSEFNLTSGQAKLVGQIKHPEKKHLEKLHTLIFNPIIPDQGVRNYNLDDQIEISLFTKYTSANKACWIEKENTAQVAIINDQTWERVFSTEKKRLGDFQYSVIGKLGLIISKDLLPNLNSDTLVQSLGSTDIVYTSGEEEYTAINLNALGVIVGSILQDRIDSNFDSRSHANVLKSFAKRVLFKVLPVVLLILLGNFVYQNGLKSTNAELEYEKSLLQEVTLQKENNRSKNLRVAAYEAEIARSMSMAHADLLNKIISSHRQPIIYKQIHLLNTGKRNGRLLFRSDAGTELSPWMLDLERQSRISEVSLGEYELNRKGYFQGQLWFTYD